MKAVKTVLVVIGLGILAIVIGSAIIPEKDCAGNNTWKTAEVCKK